MEVWLILDIWIRVQDFGFFGELGLWRLGFGETELEEMKVFEI